ncbi:hypothetical protein K505DRAFT_10036 [Melanomma pulvis-pyrius CBS 109.77]|uniref:Uncharacterized protein n=1 Tax=Melanomma pulvis-pyrius CBS 109.77 TaxID=1314802 RepID=A0A6A6WN72_9PLEO|nr:hypothetical protein K505DRAFT_10036 [Melanomma pulvis-pyrius CBS 109.77]
MRRRRRLYTPLSCPPLLGGELGDETTAIIHPFASALHHLPSPSTAFHRPPPPSIALHCLVDPSHIPDGKGKGNDDDDDDGIHPFKLLHRQGVSWGMRR